MIVPHTFLSTVHLLLPSGTADTDEANRLLRAALTDALRSRGLILDWAPVRTSAGDPSPPQPLQIPGDYQDGDLYFLVDDQIARQQGFTYFLDEDAPAPKDTDDADALYERIRDAAEQHGSDNGDFQYQMGDLEITLQAALRLMTPEQRQRLLENPEVDDWIAEYIGTA